MSKANNDTKHVFHHALENVYNDFVQKQNKENQEILITQKSAILQQVYSNLNFSQNVKEISDELSQIIYANGHGLSLINKGDNLESDNKEIEDDIHSIAARNLLRYITRGIPVDRKTDQAYEKSFQLLDKALIEQKNTFLLDNVRIEIQKMWENAGKQLAKINPNDEKLFEIFQSNLLASYPFLDPKAEESIIMPQKIHKQWVMLKYLFEKIDISPQSGFLSKMIEEEDRIYAYGLVPHSSAPKEAQPHLLLMGTTYPTGQGARLATLENFRPQHSVGESHDLTHLIKWIQDKKQIKVTGHSKGATMAMIIATRYPSHISEANCLNPTGLCEYTLNRIYPLWSQLKSHERPLIQIYAQKNDPVFPLENGFLPGMHIYRIIPNNNHCSNFKKFNSYVPLSIQNLINKITEAHLTYYAGRNSALVLKVNPNSENFTLRREFFADMKGALCYGLYPKEYLEFSLDLSLRKLQRNLPQNKLMRAILKPIRWGSSGSFALLTLVVILFIGVLASLFSGIKLVIKKEYQSCSKKSRKGSEEMTQLDEQLLRSHLEPLQTGDKVKPSNNEKEYAKRSIVWLYTEKEHKLKAETREKNENAATILANAQPAPNSNGQNSASKLVQC